MKIYAFCIIWLRGSPWKSAHVLDSPIKKAYSSTFCVFWSCFRTLDINSGSDFLPVLFPPTTPHTPFPPPPFVVVCSPSLSLSLFFFFLFFSPPPPPPPLAIIKTENVPNPEVELLSNWILVSCQPHTVASRQTRGPEEETVQTAWSDQSKAKGRKRRTPTCWLSFLSWTTPYGCLRVPTALTVLMTFHLACLPGPERKNTACVNSAYTITRPRFTLCLWSTPYGPITLLATNKPNC